MKSLACACRLVAVYAGLLGLFLFIGESCLGLHLYAATGQDKPCPECKEAWTYAKDIMGGQYECMHGPWLDETNCGKKPEGGWSKFDFVKNCKEISGKGNCECFKCGLSNDCAGEILLWLPWCGFKEDKKGTCVVETLKNKEGKPVTGPDRFERKAKTADGKACDFGKNAFVKGDYCGMEGGVPHSCVSKNGCVGFGAWVGNLAEITHCKGNTGWPKPPIIKPGGDPVFITLPNGELKQIQ
jgi:hypothetical protein